MNARVCKRLWLLVIYTHTLLPPVLGTPTEQTWPGMLALPEFTNDYPMYERMSLAQLFPKIDDVGIDLLEVLPLVFLYLWFCMLSLLTRTLLPAPAHLRARTAYPSGNVPAPRILQ